MVQIWQQIERWFNWGKRSTAEVQIRSTESETTVPASTRSGDYGQFVRSGHGIAVTKNTVEGITAYWRATNIIAGTIAMLPLSLREKLPDGSNREAVNHPLYRLLHRKPSKRHTSFNFRRMLQEQLCYYGNAYARIIRNGAGVVVDLQFLDARAVFPFEDEWTEEVYYEVVLKSGKIITLQPYEIIHIKGPGSDDELIGKNPIQVHRESLGENIAIREYGTGFFVNGGHISGVLQHPGRLSASAAERIETGFATKYGGMRNAGKVAVLEEGMTFEKVGVTPKDALFMDARNFGVSDIARITGVPEHLLGKLDRSTFNNIEHLSKSNILYTFLPWITNWEQELNAKLLYENEQNFYTYFNVNGLLRGDTEARTKQYTGLFSIGAMSPNDARRKEDMPPIDGGDRYFVPINNVGPLDRLDELLFNNNNANQNAKTEDNSGNRAQGLHHEGTKDGKPKRKRRRRRK